MRLTLLMLPEMSASMFPRAERMLEQTDVQEALQYVSGRKKMNRYRSITDYLFSELIGGKWKNACFRFYEGDGPDLKSHPDVSKDLLRQWDKQLCIGLKLAMTCKDQKQVRCWRDFRTQWQQSAA